MSSYFFNSNFNQYKTTTQPNPTSPPQCYIFKILISTLPKKKFKFIFHSTPQKNGCCNFDVFWNFEKEEEKKLARPCLIRPNFSKLRPCNAQFSGFKNHQSNHIKTIKTSALQCPTCYPLFMTSQVLTIDVT